MGGRAAEAPVTGCQTVSPGWPGQGGGQRFQGGWCLSFLVGSPGTGEAVCSLGQGCVFWVAVSWEGSGGPLGSCPCTAQFGCQRPSLPKPSRAAAVLREQCGPRLRGGHRPVRLAPGWSRAPPSSAGLFSLRVSEVASPPQCSWRSASCSVSWRQWPVFVGVPALSACRVPPRRLWPSPPFQLCKVSKMPRAAVALQWPSRLWAPLQARSSPSFSNPQRLRLPREARPEPQPSLLHGQTSVQPSLVRVTSPRLSGACPQRPQHPTCSGKHAGAEPPSCSCRHLPWAHARSRRGWGRGQAASQQRGREAGPSSPPHPASVGATSEGPAV